MNYSIDQEQADSVEFIEEESGSQLLLKTVSIENMERWSANDLLYEQDDRTSDYLKGDKAMNVNLKG